MSVIVKDSSGDIWLYCKGADSSILPLIAEGKIQKAIAHVTDFSMVRCPVRDNRRTKARAKANSQKFRKRFSYKCTKNRNCNTTCCNFVFHIEEAIRIF